MITTVRDGSAIAVAGDPNHPMTRGWLCVKVSRYLERVYHPKRVLTPLRRAGAKSAGHFEPIAWDEALATIAGRWRAIIAEYGAEAILPYSYTGVLGLVQCMVAESRLFNRLGASQLERSICGAAGELAIQQTLGGRLAPEYSDLLHSRLVVLWGSNPHSTAPHLMPFLRDAQRNGCELIVIDPLRTPSAAAANWHLAPLPGTDGALALGVANVLIAEGLVDHEYVRQHVAGYEEFAALAAQFPPARAAAITGLSAGDIVELARRYAATRPAHIRTTDGVQRHASGGNTIRAIAALPALTGNYGLRGGGLAYSTSDVIVWDAEAIGHASECPPPGRTINMNRLGAALLGEAEENGPPIKALYIFNTNPVVSAPNSGKIIAGLQREDLFTVVHELFLTDTARYADIILPATTQLEHVDLNKGYGHHYLTYNRPAIAPLGEARSNWDVMRALAEALGFTEPWLRQTADDVIAEILQATPMTREAGITLERLQAEGTVRLPLPEDYVPFADGIFATPSGKVELAPEGLGPPLYRDNPESPAGDPELAARYPLMLISSGAHHFLSSSFANMPTLRRKQREPIVTLHPDDAAPRGIVDGDTVEIFNDRGVVRMRARVADELRRGVVGTVKGWWHSLSPDGKGVNWLTSDRLADTAGNSTFHATLVDIRKIADT